MELYASFKRDPMGLRPVRCQVEKIVEMSKEDYEEFLSYPLDEHPEFIKSDDAPAEIDGTLRCIMVFGKERDDGVLLAPFRKGYARYLTHIPEAREVVRIKLEHVASDMVSSGLDASSHTSTMLSFRDIYEQYGLVMEEGNGISDMLIELIERHKGVSNAVIISESKEIRVDFFPEYCKDRSPDYMTEEQCKQWDKTQLTSRILDYMAEYFQDDQLYDILHHSLEMSHEEIEALGFELRDCYEVQEPEWDMDAEYVNNPLSSYKTESLVATYEELFHVPYEEKITEYFGDYGSHYFKSAIADEQKMAAYEKALAIIEMDNEAFQREKQFTGRGAIICRMRDCLLAKELQSGETVLFVGTEPFGNPASFALRSGVIQTIDYESKACTIKGDFFEMGNVPLHYVLGRHDPSITERHYGYPNVAPLFHEDRTLAANCLLEAEQKWSEEQKFSESSSPVMSM